MNMYVCRRWNRNPVHHSDFILKANNIICLLCFQVHPFYLEPEKNIFQPSLVFFFYNNKQICCAVLFHLLCYVYVVVQCIRVCQLTYVS